MEIKGKVHCFFEQSGTFKNEFIKLGYEAFDYDIQNEYGQTDYVIDLFNEIEKAYEEKPSIFDTITQDDLIIAFFPCIYFTGSSNPLLFCGIGYHKPILECIPFILKRNKDRAYFYELLLKFCSIVIKKNLKMIFENPYSSQHYLKDNFIFQPEIFDKNRMLRGDYFVKPTAYWFINCTPTSGESYQFDKEQKTIRSLPSGKGDGLCSKERSEISPDYARNFICDFILGKKQNLSQLSLF